MKVFPPTHVDPRDIKVLSSEPSGGYERPSDVKLERYVAQFWSSYSQVIEEYFSEVKEFLPVCSNLPFESTVIRLGKNGVVIGHRPSERSSVHVAKISEFEPPLKSWNLIEIQERLQAVLIEFDAGWNNYTEEQACNAGMSFAFREVLDFFWLVIEPNAFERLCHNLIVAEEIRILESSTKNDETDIGAVVYFDEPGKFVREEIWKFHINHHHVRRVSAALVREVEASVENGAQSDDVICLMTSGDLTSIGQSVSVESPNVRVWDRMVLNGLLHKHPEILSKFFSPYADALDKVTKDQRREVKKFETLLRECPTGREYSSKYEEIGLEFIKFLFPESLGEAKVQPSTDDGVERRDVVTRNNRNTRFFQRLGQRFDADFIIWDFKNYGQAIKGKPVKDAANYANKTLGRFVVVISRRGGGKAARAAQIRQLNKKDIAVIVVSDEQLLEMVRRVDVGDAPEDLLEDLLDELLIAS